MADPSLPHAPADARAPGPGGDPAGPRRHLRPLGWLTAAWLAAGIAAGIRLHRRGGTFGEAVPLADSVVGALLHAAPWAMAAAVAWIAAGRRPPRRGDVLPAVTVHVAVGFAVVGAVHLLQALLQATLVPAELVPVDPWTALPGEVVRRGPAALGVYLVLVGVAAVIRGGASAPGPDPPPGAEGQEGAGSGDEGPPP